MQMQLNLDINTQPEQYPTAEVLVESVPPLLTPQFQASISARSSASSSTANTDYRAQSHQTRP